MTATANISFLHPWFLLLGVFIPILFWWYLKKRDKRNGVINVPDLSAFEGVTFWREKLRWLLPILRMIALALLIIVLARPQENLKEEEINAEGIDIMMVMDLSGSMLAKDFEPNRLESAKEKAVEFVNKRPYDRIGLSVFAGEAFTQSPLTTDHNLLKSLIEDLSTGYLENGTAIGMGLASGVNRLKDSKAKSKVIILLTDGVNNKGYIDPSVASELAEELGIKVYTIGVGSNGYAPMPVGKSFSGEWVFRNVRVEIDEELLKGISERTGGEYFRAIDTESLEKIYSKIDELEKTKIEVTVIKRTSEMFYIFAFIALILVIFELVLRYTVFRTIP